MDFVKKSSFKANSVTNDMISVTKGIDQYNDYISKLKGGYVPGIKTPYSNLNEAMLDGIPKNTVCCIAGHSGSGKTTLLNNIIMHAPIANPNTVVLFFTLEMPVRSLISRIISAANNIKVKDLYLKAADIDIDQSQLEALSKLPIYYYEYGGSDEEIYNYICLFCSESQPGYGKEVLMCLDHTLLVDGDDEHKAINNLVNKLNIIKKRYSNANGDKSGNNKACVTSLILSQLNDSMLKPERLHKSELMYPLYTDIYFGRQLYHICDVMLVLNSPYKYLKSNGKGTEYNGRPLTHVVNGKEERILYAHIIKGRDVGESIQEFINKLEVNTIIPLKRKNVEY